MKYIIMPLLYLSVSVLHSQEVTLLPTKPALGEEVLLTFNADEGNAGLKDHEGEIYLHTGLITNQSTGENDWRKVVTEWNDNQDKLRLTRIDRNTYTLRFVISDLYGVAATGGNVVGLAMVFRSADGSKVGKTADEGDIVYYLSQPDFRAPEEILKVSQTPHPNWAKDAVIYEVNVRQYTKEGTLEAFARHLPRLADLGVDILWMMPVQPIGKMKRKGGLGSYYSISDYTAIHPDYGGEEDFRAVVDQAHDLGMKVVLDWVANHSAHDHHWTVEHPDWYNRDEEGNIIAPYDWSDVADLNFDNEDMRDAMINEMIWWIVKMDIDGFRCDVAGEVDTRFWNTSARALGQLKPLWMLAENGDKMDLLNYAFNANYGWDLHHTLNSIAKGDKNAYDVQHYLNWMTDHFPKGTYPMQFVSNHDENSWQGSVYERFGDGHKAFALLTFTVPGIPLIYSGMEAGLDKRLAFFEKDEIDWSDLSMQDFYTQLTTLKHQNSALWNGAAGASIHYLQTGIDDKVLAFVRDHEGSTVVVVINLTDQLHQFRLQLTDTYAGKYKSYFDDDGSTLEADQQLSLAPWGYKVYVR